MQTGGEKMSAAHGADTQLEPADFGEVVDVAQAKFIDRKLLPFERVSGRKEFVFIHAFDAAKKGVRVTKHHGRFEEKAIEVFSRMIAILAPGKSRLPLNIFPGLVVGSGRGDAP